MEWGTPLRKDAHPYLCTLRHAAFNVDNPVPIPIKQWSWVEGQWHEVVLLYLLSLCQIRITTMKGRLHSRADQNGSLPWGWDRQQEANMSTLLPTGGWINKKTHPRGKSQVPHYQKRELQIWKEKKLELELQVWTCTFKISIETLVFSTDPQTHSSSFLSLETIWGQYQASSSKYT